ncbi:Potassium voltage-gated channel sub H member 5 [Perkinsus olseni]|uniref:Potassium voltage-gated channel sub H member 5 n=1 Tax=Perkinsus olseni TaxID=32597 RepID=A0A7J6M5U8_PEROL|nr:Potassium voltage-gated channel sub H member 5 [Perkinsus olseni]
MRTSLLALRPGRRQAHKSEPNLRSTMRKRGRMKSMTDAGRKLVQKGVEVIARQVEHRDAQQLTMMEQTYEGFFTDFDEDCVDHYRAEEKPAFSFDAQRIIGNRQKIGDSHNLGGAGLSVLATGQASLATLYGSQRAPESKPAEPSAAKILGLCDRVKETLQRSECFVWPDSRFRRTWDLILLFLILYQAVTVPLLLAFPYIHLSGGYKLFEDVVTVFFLLDVLVNFCTGYQRPNGVIEMGAKEVALHYLKGWFLLDLLASFPYSWIITAAAGTDSAASRGPNLLRIIRVGRIARGLKLVRVLKLKGVMDELSASLGGALVESCAMTLIGMAKFSVLVLLIAHWNACAFGMVGWELYRSGSENWMYRLEYAKGAYPTELVTLHQRPCVDGETAELQATSYTNWDDYTPGDRICVLPDVYEAYLQSMFWSLQTIAAVGYGNVYGWHWGERLYSIIAMLLGCAAFGLTVGYVQTLYSSPDIVLNHFQTKRRNTLTYLRRNLRLPPAIMEKVQTYFRSQEERLPMFSECPNVDAQLPANLVLKLVPVEYGPNDVLFECGELADCVYFLARGKVRLLNKSSRSSMTLRDNGYDTHFGELSLLVNSVRIVQAQCLTFSEFYVLHTIDFLESIMEFPQELALDTSPLLHSYVGMARKILKEAKERRVQRKRRDRQRNVLSSREDKRELTGILQNERGPRETAGTAKTSSENRRSGQPMRMRSGLKFARIESMRALESDRSARSSMNTSLERSEPTGRREGLAELVEGWEELRDRVSDASVARDAYKRRKYRSKSCIDQVIEIPVEKPRRATWTAADISRGGSASSVVGGHFLVDMPVDRSRRQSWLARAQQSLELEIMPDSDTEEATRSIDPMSPGVHTILFPGHAITDVPRDKSIRDEWIDKADAHAIDTARRATSAGPEEPDKAMVEFMSERESYGRAESGTDSLSESDESSGDPQIRRSRTGIRLRASSKRRMRLKPAMAQRQQKLTGYRLKQKLEMFETPMWESVPCMRDVSSDIFPWQTLKYARRESEESEDEEREMRRMSALFLLEDTATSSQTRLRRAREHLRAVVMKKAAARPSMADKINLQRAQRERALASNRNLYSRTHSYHSAMEATRSGYLGESEEPVLQTLQRSADLKHRLSARYEGSESIFTSHTTATGGKFGGFEIVHMLFRGAVKVRGLGVDRGCESSWFVSTAVLLKTPMATLRRRNPHPQCIVGYGGFIPGRIAEDLHGSTHSKENLLATKLARGPRLERACFGENDAKVRKPWLPTTGYCGTIRGKDSNDVYGVTHKTAGTIASKLVKHPVFQRSPLGPGFWSSATGAGLLHAALVHRSSKHDLNPLYEERDLLELLATREDLSNMTRSFDRVRIPPRTIPRSMSDNREISYQPPPDCRALRRCRRGDGTLDPALYAKYRGCAAGASSYSTKMDPLRQSSWYGKVRFGGGRT